jgi:hypothetical protein
VFGDTSVQAKEAVYHRVNEEAAMSNDRVSRLAILREELAQISMAPFPTETWPIVEAWIAKATPVIRSDWPHLFEEFQRASDKPKGGVIRMGTDFTISEHERRRLWRVDNEETERVKRNLLNFLDGILALAPTQSDRALDTVLLICKRFSIFAQQLKTRERGRPPFEIEDEYDVQYLLLALLRLHFEDVRKEEWTPSYAGGSSRMDFLLKRERIVIEAKKTRDTLNRDSQIGDQLIVDIKRYAEHPDCQALVCFVYDPDMLLDNPKGLEQDLSATRERIEVIVVVSPSGI